MTEKLIWRDLKVRAVHVPLRRPVVSKVGEFEKLPLILLDLETEQGIVGRSYLVPYLSAAVRYIIPAIRDLAEARKGKPVAPFDVYERGRKALGLVGLEGVSLIAVSGIDMVAWDALAKAAGQPLAVFLGGSVGPVPAYNSSGLWLGRLDGLADEAAALAAEDGGFGALTTGTGSDVWKRIAAPMVGGIFTSSVLELVVYPAIYEIWKWHFEMKRARADGRPRLIVAEL